MQLKVTPMKKYIATALLSFSLVLILSLPVFSQVDNEAYINKYRLNIEQMFMGEVSPPPDNEGAKQQLTNGLRIRLTPTEDMAAKDIDIDVYEAFYDESGKKTGVGEKLGNVKISKGSKKREKMGTYKHKGKTYNAYNWVFMYLDMPKGKYLQGVQLVDKANDVTIDYAPVQYKGTFAH
jgi:hypothetical protein